jgi:radical SAM protein with 4Fe4S-binding SPASM domain
MVTGRKMGFRTQDSHDQATVPAAKDYLMSTLERLKRILPLRPPQPELPVEAGLFHYLRQARDNYTRFHLRVEPDGRGLLLANATAAVRLSPTGVLIAKRLLDDAPEQNILRDLKANFTGATQEMMQRDLERVAGLIANLANPDDNYPIINLEDAAISPYESRLIAPLQADVPLAKPEHLYPILSRLWNAAIPHVTFLAGLQPDPTHLIRAVEKAEDLGMIAGVRARATDLNQGRLIEHLAVVGVDYITLLYASTEAEVHDALVGAGDHAITDVVLAAVQDADVAAVAEIPLVATTISGLAETLDVLQTLGIHNYSFFAIAAPDELPADEATGAIMAMGMAQTASLVEELSDTMDVRFVWQPPVLRDPAQTLAEQVQRGPRCSGDVAVRVEPDGRVISARGPYRSAGNILTDSWPDIWNDPAFINYRERIERPTRCDECPGLAICAADCPRKPAGWSHGIGGAR